MVRVIIATYRRIFNYICSAIHREYKPETRPNLVLLEQELLLFTQGFTTKTAVLDAIKREYLKSSEPRTWEEIQFLYRAFTWGILTRTQCNALRNPKTYTLWDTDSREL